MSSPSLVVMEGLPPLVVPAATIDAFAAAHPAEYDLWQSGGARSINRISMYRPVTGDPTRRKPRLQDGVFIGAGAEGVVFRVRVGQFEGGPADDTDMVVKCVLLIHYANQSLRRVVPFWGGIRESLIAEAIRAQLVGPAYASFFGLTNRWAIADEPATAFRAALPRLPDVEWMKLDVSQPVPSDARVAPALLTFQNYVHGQQLHAFLHAHCLSNDRAFAATIRAVAALVAWLKQTVSFVHNDLSTANVLMRRVNTLGAYALLSVVTAAGVKRRIRIDDLPLVDGSFWAPVLIDLSRATMGATLSTINGSATGFTKAMNRPFFVPSTAVDMRRLGAGLALLAMGPAPVSPTFAAVAAALYAVPAAWVTAARGAYESSGRTPGAIYRPHSATVGEFFVNNALVVDALVRLPSLSPEQRNRVADLIETAGIYDNAPYAETLYRTVANAEGVDHVAPDKVLCWDRLVVAV